MSMTLEDLIKLVAMIGIPALGSVAWLITMLMTIRADLKKIEVQLEMRNNLYEDRISRLERHVHDIRNSLQALTLGLARKGLDDEPEQGR
jgi:hypothetical protein